MKEYKQILKVAGKEVEVSTGKIAGLAQGSIMLKMGGTVLFAAVTVNDSDTDLDYFPLSVEYIEKMYARGAISGSRFRKREGLPSDEATIKAREVDHSIRSLFPKGFKKPVQVVLTVLAYDGENDPQALTVLGSSLALMQAGIPFQGPCASVVVGVDKDEKLTVNPSAENREDLLGEFIVSGVDNRPLSIEGWGKELTDEKMDEILDTANKEIIEINKQQNEFVSSIERSMDLYKQEFSNSPASDEALDFVKSNFNDDIKTALFKPRNEREELLSGIKKAALEKVETDEVALSSNDLMAAIDYVARKHLRAGVLDEDKRVSGRKLDEVRELSAEIDVLPTVHGSALFSRGQTQSLSIVTLAPKSSQLLIDDMEGEESKSFMHHYNFPPYSTGEAGRYSYHPGRREIGHGAIGENALRNMLPSLDDFPYTVRAVSEIMSSNGSTSMAATCASSMALMAAGVPMKAQVAGIGVGLVTNDENVDEYKLILDIEGIEDFYGDMDFKICGTDKGITAIQYENKLQGVPLRILKDAIRLANTGRKQVLEVMNKTISQPKDSVPANAPKVERISIQQDQIGELIGPGGKNIKDLVERSGEFAKEEAEINVEDDGTVFISAMNAEQMNFLKSEIEAMFKKPVIGEIYEGKVGKITDYGAFVDVSRSISGLLHISEMGDDYVKDPRDVLKEGEMVKVKVLKIDEKGRINFTRKGLDK